MMNPTAFKHLDQFGGEIPEWVKSVREPAKSIFLNAGFPNRKNEAWRYTNLKPLSEIDFNWSHARGMITPREIREFFVGNEWPIVFVDGILDTNISAQTLDQATGGLTVKPFSHALRDDPTALQEILRQTKRHNRHALDELNDAFLCNGAFIEVSPGTRLTKPIHIVFVNTAKPKPFCFFPRIVAKIGKEAQATLVTSSIGMEQAVYLASCRIEIALEANARLEHYTLQEESPESFHFMSTQVRQERDTNYSSFFLGKGAKLSRYEVGISLPEPGAEASLFGLYLCDGKRQSDIYTHVDHLAPSCQSKQLFKGLLQDQSKSVFSGKIKVFKTAQQTNAMQLNRNLILNGGAEANVQPQLEIDADDVKCSHGATIGQLKPLELFYLRSRGIGLKEAEAILAKAFATEVVYKISDKAIQAIALAKLDQWLMRNTHGQV